MACSRPGCHQRAVAGLTYSYAESVAEIAALAADRAPGVYPLCADHVERLSVPKGWRLVRRGIPCAHPLTATQVTGLARAIRQAGGLRDDAEPAGNEPTLTGRENLVFLGHRAHLRVVADSARYRGATPLQATG